MKNSDQKTILITGSTDGVGRLVAKTVGSAGHTILVHGRDTQRAAAIAQEITGGGGKANVYLAEELCTAGVTVNAVHPATFMATTLVRESGIAPMSTVEEGAEAIIRLAVSQLLEGRTGLYFEGKQPTKANPQAYDAEARSRLRTLSFVLAGLELPGGARPDVATPPLSTPNGDISASR